MHTFKRVSDDEFIVGRLQMTQGNDGIVTHDFIPMLRGFSVASAIKMVNTLNGGECKFDDIYMKVLPSLVVKG